MAASSAAAYMGGTPLAAGGAAIVRERVNKARLFAEPSAALLKAILINGATQLPGEGVASNNSGYGRVDLKNTPNASYVIMDDHLPGLADRPHGDLHGADGLSGTKNPSFCEKLGFLILDLPLPATMAGTLAHSPVLTLPRSPSS